MVMDVKHPLVELDWVDDGSENVAWVFSSTSCFGEATPPCFSNTEAAANIKVQ